MGNTFTDGDLATAAATTTAASNCGIIGTNQRTITFEWRPNGTLTDADTVVLEDPTDTYGVRRQDNSGVAVASGTAMTSTTTGVYTHTFTEPVNGLAYDYFIKTTDLSISPSPFYSEGELAGTGEARDGMSLAEARNIVWSTTKTDSTSNSAAEVDRAIKTACDEFLRQTRFIRTTDDTINLTINTAEVDLKCVTGFRPERLYKAGIRHPRNDNGIAWSSSSISYQANEIVSNSSLFYVAKSAHTSASATQPGTTGGNAVWSRIDWDREYELEHVNYNAVSNALNRQGRQLAVTGLDDATLTGFNRPSWIGFRTNEDAVVFPPPKDNWALRLIYYQALPEWTPGTTDSITLPIPEEYIRGVLTWGASAVLVYRDWAQIQQSGSWLRFQEHIMRVNGDAHTDGVATYAIESKYM